MVQGRADIDWQLQTSTKLEEEAIWAALAAREAQLFKLLQEKRAKISDENVDSRSAPWSTHRETETAWLRHLDVIQSTAQQDLEWNTVNEETLGAESRVCVCVRVALLLTLERGCSLFVAKQQLCLSIFLSCSDDRDPLR